MLKLVIFDLDGTLLNTFRDLTGAVNTALSAAGFSARSEAEVKRFVGDGVRKLVRRALPETAEAETEARVFSDFLAAYGARDHRSTEPYPGMETLIETLAKNDVKTAVLSNKYDDAAKILVKRRFPAIDYTAGATEGVPIKPDPAGANIIMRRFDAKPSECVLVGDSRQDAETAARAGIAFAAVLWGARSKEDFAGAPVAAYAADAEALSAYFIKAWNIQSK